ncbi:hypothetical protein EV360DRAFT_58312 [Lentinula raphanica]|nr:hypothetical protein EV360DRAFT_58312 [Lentinula raphanica]
MAVKKVTAFARFLNASTRRKATTTRKPWRVRTKRTPIKLTPQEKAVKKAARKQEKLLYQEAIADAHQQIYALAAEIHAKFPKFSADRITADIFQSERLKVSTKDVGPYAAFLSAEAKRFNDAEEAEGRKRWKINQLAKKISEKWKNMSQEERIEATKDDLEALRERRENKEVGTHNVDVTSSQDSTITAEKLKEAVSTSQAPYQPTLTLVKLQRLGVRTADEGLLIVTRGNMTRFHKPYVWTTSSRVDAFFESVYKAPPTDIGYRMDAYMVSGVEGVARTHVQAMADLKKEVRSLIFRKLQECAGTAVPKMFYTGFDHYITARYGIVIKNWPLPTFTNPSQISTKTELDILWAAWNSDATSFYRMTTREFQEWENERAEAARNSGEQGRGEGEPGADAVSRITPPVNTEGVAAAGNQGSTGVSNEGGVADKASEGGTAAHVSSSTAGPSNFVSMNMVTDANGAAVLVTGKRPRKPRSDKGKTHKKKARAAAVN